MSDINNNNDNKKHFLNDTTNTTSSRDEKLLIKRRKSDSNLLKTNDTHMKSQVAQSNRQRNAQIAHQVNKSISITLAEKRLKKDDAPQEDTFYRALEIKFHHSVGSMSISPACRDVVLAG